MKKLKFYLFGLGMGMIFVYFVLFQKEASCSYFPNDRVIAETLTKEFKFNPEFKAQLNTLGFTQEFFRDSILSEGNVDFGQSEAQRQPCPRYILTYPYKAPTYKVYFEKCKDTATFFSIKSIR